MSDKNKTYLYEHLEVCVLISQIQGINGPIFYMKFVEKYKVDI
jgi:hypothetical protein